MLSVLNNIEAESLISEFQIRDLNSYVINLPLKVGIHQLQDLVITKS